LAGLLARGFEAWPLPKVVEAHRQSRPIPQNVFVVTFDDGYENNLLYALPVLEELRVPASIFLATGFLDSDRPFPFDNWSNAGSPRVPADTWRPLTTAQARHLAAHELIDLGAHTHTHGAFAGRTDDFRRDLSESLQVMRDRFGISRPTFTFPFGVTTPEMIRAAEESGVVCALNTRPERIDPSSDPFHWGRFTTSNLDSSATLAAKLDGWYTPVADVLRKIKRPVALVAPKAIGELIPLSKPCFAVDRDGSGERGSSQRSPVHL
jgi:peptidoglycan/xylan/chitin deacetylase (PgdA/CDA1 family)